MAGVNEEDIVSSFKDSPPLGNDDIILVIFYNIRKLYHIRRYGDERLADRIQVGGCEEYIHI